MISKARLFRYYFLFIFFVCIALCSFSQKCSCPEYYQFRAEQENKNAESSRYTGQLTASGNIICQAKGYEWMAIDYTNENIADTAEMYYRKAEKKYKESGCSDSIYLNIHKYRAQLYYTNGDFAKAQEHSFKLLQAAQDAGNPYEVAICYTMIAQLLNQTGQAEKGIIYSRLALPLLRKIADPVENADVLFKLSKRYLWHYQDTKNLPSLDSSELFSRQQLVIAQQIKKNSSIAAAWSNLQGIAWERKDFKTALAFLDSSFKYTGSNNQATLAINYYDKADLLLELKNLNEAERMADSAMYYYQQSGAVAYIAETYGLLSRIAREKGNYKRAFEASSSARAITDSIKNVEKTKEVTELEKKYSQAKNERTIKELAQQKRIYLLLALAGLFLLAALVFFIRQQSLKNKQKVMETEQRLNRARMNPHFFFNALSSLQSFALTENDGKALAGNLSKFSHIMRETLESTYKEYTTVEEETIFLNEYLELQKMRFPQKFTYAISAPLDMEPDELLLPAMILQPFAENSIEHGFAGISYPGHLAVSFEKGKNELHISITDNGKGLIAGAHEKSAGTIGGNHISRASQIIKDRIYLLNTKLKTKASFTVSDNHPAKGVTVFIKLPLLYRDDVKH